MTSSNSQALLIVNRLVYLLPTLVILAGCIIYLGKRKSVEAVLMLAGQALLLVGGLISAFFLALITAGALPHTVTGVYLPVLSAFSLLGGLLFAAGFIMTALRQTAPPRTAGAVSASQREQVPGDGKVTL